MIRQRVQRPAIGVLLWAFGWAAFAPAAWADRQDDIEAVTQQEPSEADQRLTRNVKQHLHSDPEVLALMDDIQIKAVDGVLYVKGTVLSDSQKAVVEKRIRICPGVERVKSFIDVRKSPVDRVR